MIIFMYYVITTGVICCLLIGSVSLWKKMLPAEKEFYISQLIESNIFYEVLFILLVLGWIILPIAIIVSIMDSLIGNKNDK